MTDNSWDDQFKSFLKKTGDDLKRMGEDLRSEAQKLLDKAQDPQTQEKVRAKAKEVGTWAKQAAADVADLVEKGAQKAEDAVRNVAKPGPSASDDVTPPNATPAPKAAPARTTAPRAASATAKKSGGVSKSLGPKKRPEAGAPKKKPATKKTIGRKPKA